MNVITKQDVLKIKFSVRPKYLPVAKIGQCQRYKEYDIEPIKTNGGKDNIRDAIPLVVVPTEINNALAMLTIIA